MRKFVRVCFALTVLAVAGFVQQAQQNGAGPRASPKNSFSIELAQATRSFPFADVRFSGRYWT